MRMRIPEWKTVGRITGEMLPKIVMIIVRFMP